HATAGRESIRHAEAMPGEHHRSAVVPIPVADAEPTEADVVLIILNALRECGGREVVGRRQFASLTECVPDYHPCIVTSHCQRKIADIDTSWCDALLADGLVVALDLHHR